MGHTKRKGKYRVESKVPTPVNCRMIMKGIKLDVQGRMEHSKRIDKVEKGGSSASSWS